jgi:quinoprotein glucose dehydrogenase
LAARNFAFEDTALFESSAAIEFPRRAAIFRVLSMKPIFLFVACLLVALNLARAVEPAGHGSSASAAGVAPASNEGDLAMKSFQFDEGLKIELWAAEPMLANGVAFSQDEKGRWYVAETFRQERGVEDNRKYKQWQDEDIASKSTADRLAMMHKHFPDEAKFREQFATYEDRIRRLEDSTGSGRADKSIVFADGFTDPLDGTGAGILARGSDVWWTCIPNLWHFADRNDDGVAEVKEKLLSGFGIKFALRGHDLHGLRFGPDGKLYFSIGDRALHVTTKEGTEIPQTESGSIMRCNPDGTGFEIFATGVRNPQELVFDEHGNLWTGDNNSDAGDKARFTYLVEGGDCGWRMAFQYLPDRGPWMRERPWDEKIAPTVRYIVPCVANISNGPSGLTYNPGTGLSAKYQRKFYLSDFRGGANASVVHEISVQPKGAFFTATDRDWVKGVLTSDVEFGNDGSLYVLDWVASWGGVGKGRIYKFSDPSADRELQKQTEKLIGEGMSKRPETELATLLGHADMRVRQAAQFELATRGAASAKVFATVAAEVKAKNPLARLHAIWGLGQLGEKSPATLSSLPALLADANPEVRAQTAKVLGDRKVATAGEKLTALLKDSEARVRFFAAASLGKIKYAAAFSPLCVMLDANNDTDPILRHGGIMGLAGTGTPEQIAKLSTHNSVAVRGAATVALRRLQSPLVAEFLKDTDPSVVLDGARAIHDVPIEAAMPALAALATTRGISDLNVLNRAVNANYRLGKADNARVLATLAADSAAPEGARKDAIDALASWANPDPKDRLLNQWRPLPPRGGEDAAVAMGASIGGLLKDSTGAIQEIVAKLAGQLTIASAGEPLFLLASNDRATPNARVEAIRSLAILKDPHLPEIAKIATADKDARVRNEGLQALADTNPGAAVKIIGQMVNTGTTLERQGAMAALSRITGPEAQEVIGDLVDRLTAGQIAAEIQVDALEAARRSDSPAIKAKLVKYEASFPAGDELAKYRVALVGGDEERGRRIFREKAETQCLRCHRSETGDSVVGPELTHIGKSKDRQYLLESIVLPNKHIAQGFETVVLTLTDGNIVVGRLVSQDARALKVETLDASGRPKTDTFELAKIQQRDSAPSPMPPGMGEILTRSELRDLVEYLANRK